MKKTLSEDIQITASSSVEGGSISNEYLALKIAGGVGALILACNNLPIESQPGIKALVCSNGASDIVPIKAEPGSSDEVLARIIEYNKGAKADGVSVIETSTIVTRFNGVDDQSNGGFVEMAISQAPIGGSSDLGSQTIVSFKSDEGKVEAFSFNPTDDTNMLVSVNPNSGNTMVFFAGRSFGGDDGTTTFMQINFEGSVTQEEVMELLSKGDHSRILELIVKNPLTNTCCVVAGNDKLDQNNAQFLNQLASLDTEAGAPIVNSGTSTPNASTPQVEVTIVPNTPIPSSTPSEVEATSVAYRSALLGLGYTDAELKDYTISEGTYSFPGDTVIHNGIIGTKADGTKEIFAFKFSDNPNYIKLSGSEIRELNEKAGENLIFGEYLFFNGYEKGSSKVEKVMFNVFSTGIVESFNKVNTEGNVVGTVQTILMVARAENESPRLVRYIVQMQDPSQPDENLLKELQILGLSAGNQTQVLSQKELAGFFPKGLGMEVIVYFEVDSLESYKWSVIFRRAFGSDEAYLSALKEFLLSHGVTQNTDNPIIMFASANELIK